MLVVSIPKTCCRLHAVQGHCCCQRCCHNCCCCTHRACPARLRTSGLQKLLSKSLASCLWPVQHRGVRISQRRESRSSATTTKSGSSTITHRQGQQTLLFRGCPSFSFQSNRPTPSRHRAQRCLPCSRCLMLTGLHRSNLHRLCKASAFTPAASFATRSRTNITWLIALPWSKDQFTYTTFEDVLIPCRCKVIVARRYPAVCHLPPRHISNPLYGC